VDAFPPLPPPPGWKPPPEPPAEEPERSRRGPVLALGVAVVVSTLLVVGLWGSRSTDACEASTVESARFGYCIRAPGWRLTNEELSVRLPYDELIRPADASSVRIVAIELDPGQDLDLVVQTVRSIETEGGIDVSAVVDRRVAGVPAAQWDIALEAGSSDARHIREVVFVREGTAWRVQLLADAQGFAIRVGEFERILRSWIFR
jgi:hypothetical protein